MGCLIVVHFCSAERSIPKENTGCVRGFKEQLFIATQAESGNQIRKSNQNAASLFGFGARSESGSTAREATWC